MYRHKDVWRALDHLAAKHNLSASGLARRAGLDATAFNKSKRTTREGRPRWPGTESLSKVLNCTGETMASFADLLGERGGSARTIPVVGYAKAGASGYFDEAGYPAGHGWDQAGFPGLDDPHAYALKISGDSMEPAYRPGDVIVVSPSATVRRGDRVVVRSKRGEIMAKELIRKTPQGLDLRSLNPGHGDRRVAAKDVAWMARILWVSQ